MTPEYEMLIKLLHSRMSVRRFKSDPLPEGAIEKILEAGRWAMSGANGQPWEYLVVTDPAIKQALFEYKRNEVNNFSFWMEQIRVPELRHPAQQLSGETEDRFKMYMTRPGFANAPAVIAVLGDGRRQWATVMAGHTLGRHASHLTDGLANTCTLMHLAAASLGLGTQWLTTHIEDGFKRILKVPDYMSVYVLIPVGYPDVPARKGVRRPLADMVHYNQYDYSKHMSHRDIIEYIAKLRRTSKPKYIQAPDAKKDKIDKK